MKSIKIKKYDKKKIELLPNEVEYLKRFRFLIQTENDIIPSYNIEKYNVEMLYQDAYSRPVIKVKLTCRLDSNSVIMLNDMEFGKTINLTLKTLNAGGLTISQTNFKNCYISKYNISGDYSDSGPLSADIELRASYIQKV